MVTAASLIQFVGTVVLISFIALDLYLDDKDLLAMTDNPESRSAIKYAAVMTALLAVGALLGFLSLVSPWYSRGLLYFGYLLGVVALFVPTKILYDFHRELEPRAP